MSAYRYDGDNMNQKTEINQDVSTEDRQKAIKAIREVSNKLSYALDNITWSRIYTDYLKANIAEERTHDHYRGNNTRNLSITDSGKLFAVQRIVQFYTGKDGHGNKVKMPRVKDYLHIKKTVYIAYAITANYRKQIRKALKGVDIDYILSLDYVELV